MPPARFPNSRFPSRAASEAGFALPVAILALFVVAVLAAAAAASAGSGSNQSRRDKAVKRALAAADAGIQTALYRLNKVQHQIGGALADLQQRDAYSRQCWHYLAGRLDVVEPDHRQIIRHAQPALITLFQQCISGQIHPAGRRRRPLVRRAV